MIVEEFKAFWLRCMLWGFWVLTGQLGERISVLVCGVTLGLFLGSTCPLSLEHQ